LPVLLDILVAKDTPDLKEQDLLVLKVLLVLKDQLVLKVRPVHKVI
jgi:hypothetical protein